MTSYPLLKTIHVACVVASGTGFVLRGVLAARASALLHTRPARIAPHVIDTALLAAGVAMAFAARISPFAHAWLAAKIVALLVYIALGALALERGRKLGLSPPVRVAAFVGAVATFAYIVAVAVRRNPLPWE
ncbi:MAG TPA: SirB2 family protein [Burkholderiaceae bacterium]|jgi:uncharacterized membrane protein SirB2|nr:SirB2 family protein [Burkholderiaceae bacterium]